MTMQSKIRVYESGRAEQVMLKFLHFEVVFCNMLQVYVVIIWLKCKLCLGFL